MSTLILENTELSEILSIKKGSLSTVVGNQLSLAPSRPVAGRFLYTKYQMNP